MRTISQDPAHEDEGEPPLSMLT